MSHLLRSHAPITERGWALIDEEAKTRLAPGLAARRVVDFAGPLGWDHSATNLGRIEPVSGDGFAGVTAAVRRVLPLAELRASFALARTELAAGDRGAEDVDLDPVALAALQLAEAENAAVFHGASVLGIEGITQASPHPAVAAGGDLDRYPAAVASGVESLRRVGVGGPYALVLSREDHTTVVETAEHGGYPLLDHVRKIIGGPVLWAPGVTGGIVASLRGGDFLFESGQDLSIGYDGHDEDWVRLYLEESFSFRVVTPEAAIAIGSIAGD